MGNTPDMTTCTGMDNGRGELLTLSPFNALHYHFGMLLGVDDFETEQAYHRAKMRLHNAWLHREGVVWGFGVGVDTAAGEIRVAPGLALDPAGHELHLEGDACLSVGEWFDKHEKDADFTVVTKSGKKTFDAHVVIRFKACLTRQVPSLMEPCDNSSTGTAYSRVFETVEILMLPNLAPLPVYPYHRLRLLFGIEEPRKQKDSTDITSDDQAVLDELDRIGALLPNERPAALMQAFHRFAALDEIDLRPAMSEDGARSLLFPGQDDDPVVLANITGLTLAKKNDVWVLSGGTVDTAVRPSHVATTTIQDLLCGSGENAVFASGELGPRVDPDSVTIGDTQIVLKLDQPLNPASFTSESFTVSNFETTSGWKILVIKEPPKLADGDMTVTLDLTDALGKGLVRIIARGTGTTPIVGTNNLPLAGSTKNAGAPEGTDFVFMKERN